MKLSRLLKLNQKQLRKKLLRLPQQIPIQLNIGVKVLIFTVLKIFSEEEGSGDGLRVVYFNNEFFEGKSAEVFPSELNFNWNGKQPHPDINSSDFSAIIEGLLTAPLNDDFLFHISTDGGVQFSINGKVIIDHFFSNPFKGYKNAEW